MNIENLSLKDLKIKHPKLFNVIKNEAIRKGLFSAVDSMKMGYFTNPSGDFSSVGQAVNFINDLYEKERHATNSINSVEFSMGNETDAKAVAYLEDLFKKSPLEPYAK